MNRLTFEELHWLMLFARSNDFFQSLLDFYHKREYLSYKQFYYLEREIKDAKKRGKVVLSSDEYEFLKKYSKIYNVFKKLHEMYKTSWCLDFNIYNHLIQVKQFINTSSKLPDDTIIEEHLKLYNIPGKIEKLSVEKSKSDDKYIEKFKEIQEKGRKLRKKYQYEEKESKKQPDSFQAEEAEKSKITTEVVKPYKKINDSYMYKRKGNYINIYSVSKNKLKVSIPINTFEKKNRGFYECDCGKVFFSSQDLVKHIIKMSKCLDHYISFELDEDREEEPRKAQLKYKIKKREPQKSKYININGQNLKLDECNFVIDGANVARECNNGNNGGYISNFHKLFGKLRNFQIENYIIICDRSLYYTIDDTNEYSEFINKGKIIETPGGTEADHFILKFAQDNNSFIISNDLFREFESIYGRQWIREKRISFKIINDILYFDKIYTSV